MRLTAADDANADLPPAVRARIVALQDNSEKLIGWIQLAIVIAFGVLYGLSRQTAPMNTAIWLLTPAARSSAPVTALTGIPVRCSGSARRCAVTTIS